MTLRARLAVVVAGAVAAAVVVTVGVAWLATHHRLRADIDDALASRAEGVAELATVTEYVQRTSPARGTTRPRPQREVPGIRVALLQDLSVQLVGVDGRVTTLAGAELPVRPVDLAAATEGEGSFVRNARVDGDHFRVATQAVEGGGAVQIGRDVTGTDRTLRSLAFVLTTTAAIGVLAATLIGLLVAKRALRPIDRLSEAAERVARDQDLTAPLPARATPDEVGRLTTSFNTMLAALAASRAQQQRLVTDASHELRTPLTSLRTTIELLRRADRSPDEALPAEQRDELYDHALDELSELTHLSSELVELATDARSAAGVRTTVDLGDVAGAVAARARRRTGQVIEVSTDASTVLGDAAALERAVTNLVDNACKWNPVGTAIEVTVHAGTVAVRDHGPGVPPDERERVFERFARGRDAQSVPGSGLGLAIVGQVAADHGGRAWIEAPADGGPGTVATLALSPDSQAS
ncbi:MAG: HAMP domain-containing protein [Acidimicrobiales bacterium]|nr:HAMP domain-containing protein [Acidimicrobiales bacterium]